VKAEPVKSVTAFQQPSNTQGSQGERKGEGVTHEGFGSLKKRPPDNKAKLNIDNMGLRTGFGEIVDTSSSYF